MARHPFYKRLLKEYQQISLNKLPGIKLVTNDDNLTEFIFQIKVANNPLYPDDEDYYLSIKLLKTTPLILLKSSSLFMRKITMTIP